MDQQTKLQNGLEEGRVRVEKARARALEEELKVTNLEKELSEVTKQVDAHKVEEKRGRGGGRKRLGRRGRREWNRSTLTWT